MIRVVIKIKVVDLFCGCGGMSLGFQNAGFDIVASFDSWQPAVNIYKLNFSINKKKLENNSNYYIKFIIFYVYLWIIFKLRNFK